MNNGTQGGQPPAGQPGQGQQPAQARKIPFFKPEQMRQLPAQFTAEEKAKYEQGLKNLWGQLSRHPEDSDEHRDAKRKIQEFSNTLYQKIANFRSQAAQAQAQRQAAAQQGEQAGGARPQSQGQAPQAQQQTGGGGGGGESAGNANAAPPQPQQRPQVPQKLLDHVNQFPYQIPSNLTRGTPEATKFINDLKRKYLATLQSMEQAAARIRVLDEHLQKRINAKNPLSPAEEVDWKEKKEAAQKQHSELRAFVENFRRQHQAASQQSNNANAGAGGGESAATGQAAAAGGASQVASGQENLVRPQLNTQQPAPPVANPALQSTQTVNAAIEAARNQQISGGRSLSQTGQPGPNAQANQGIPQQPGQNQQVKMEAPAPLNTAVSQIQNQQRNSIGNNSPQSAIPQSAGPQSATQQGPPRALSHSAAMTQAARSYSISNSGGGSVMGHSHPSAPARESQNVITNKMPIPKHLPERALAPPQPVAMASARPSYTGGAGNNNSIGAQPIIQQPPNVGNLTENGGRVLDKNRLEELVRQVTGGGSGLEGGGSLTPDVESSIMDVADTFVDQVLEAACRNAKERGSKILEIRDIQLVLERGYNIRIPGYASDEIRTVRKVAPSAQWIAKMSAVQAAKVTGGKGSD